MQRKSGQKSKGTNGGAPHTLGRVDDQARQRRAIQQLKSTDEMYSLLTSALIDEFGKCSEDNIVVHQLGSFDCMLTLHRKTIATMAPLRTRKP